MKKTPTPQWKDEGTYKEPSPNTDNIRVPRLEVDDASTYVDKDGSNNMTFTDAVTGTKTLAQLSAAGTGTVDTSGTPVDNDYAKFTDADTIEGRSYAEVKQDLSLDNVENTAHSTDAHTMTIDGRDVSVDGAKLDGIAAGANLYVHPNHSGDVTSVADGAQTIANDAVTYAKMQNVSATDKVLGRSTAGAGDVEEIACTAFARSILDDADEATFKATVNLEIGTDVLAQQTIGIADDNLLEVDDASAADDEWARFTANGIEGIANQTALSTLLSAVLVENDSIKLDPALSADGKYNGITETGTAGAELNFGDICYFVTATSKWVQAKADAASTSSGKIGICVLYASGDTQPTTMLLWGKVRADTAFPTFTIGAPVFISAATAGDLTSTAPSGTTNFVVRIVGYGNTGDELFFCPDNTYIELA